MQTVKVRVHYFAFDPMDRIPPSSLKLWYVRWIQYFRVSFVLVLHKGSTRRNPNR